MTARSAEREGQVGRRWTGLEGAQPHPGGARGGGGAGPESQEGDPPATEPVPVFRVRGEDDGIQVEA